MKKVTIAPINVGYPGVTRPIADLALRLFEVDEVGVGRPVPDASDEDFKEAIASLEESGETKMVPLGAVVSKLMGGDTAFPENRFNTNLSQDEQDEIYVLTYGDGRFGASVLASDQIMSKAAKQLGGNIYILPSSVHELLVISKNSSMAQDVKSLAETVREVNSSVVAAEDFLSDNVYEYTDKGLAIVA